MTLDIGLGSAYYNRGVTLGELRRQPEAIECYRRCVLIESSDAGAWNNLGNALRAAGNSDGAANAYHHAVCINPEDPQHIRNLAVTLADEKRYAEAMTYYGKASFLDPFSTETYCNLGSMQIAWKAFEPAVATLKTAVVLKPNHLKSLANLGVALGKAGDHASALLVLDRCLVCSPLSAEILINKGDVLRDLEFYLPALSQFEKALVSRPDYSQALTNRGAVMLDIMRVSDARNSFFRAYSADPANHMARWNESLACLSSGLFELGWDLHEHRFAADVVKPIWSNDLPYFSLRSPSGKPVLVVSEQGLGDELMFGTMLADFRILAGRLVVRVDDRLLSLFRRSCDEKIKFIGKSHSVVSDEYSSQIAIGSLGLFVRRKSEDFLSSANGYLRADAVRADHYRRLFKRDDAPVIGISWRSTNPESAKRRSIELVHLVDVLGKAFRGCRLINLQYGSVQREISSAIAQTGVEILQCPDVDVTHDIDEVAAVIVACDFVFSIGNATAHLAGALGIPTAVLLPVAPSWRWMTDGNATPWYTSLRLYRKSNGLTDWGDLLQTATVDFRSWNSLRSHRLIQG